MSLSLGPCGVVTLTTDFGIRDPYVAAVKGVILTHAPRAVIADISHEVPAFDVAAGAYVLAQAAPFFPPGTVHVAVVDPGVGSDRHALIVRTARALYIAPDNGLLQTVLDLDPPLEIRAVQEVPMDASPTFHGRDLFAQLAGKSLRGEDLTPLTRPVPEFVRLPAPARRPAPAHPATGRPDRRGLRTARVLWIDRFGNLITDVRSDPARDLPTSLRARIGRRRVEGLRRVYAGGSHAVPFFIWGSGGYLEIALNQGSAAALTGARIGSPVLIGAGP